MQNANKKKVIHFIITDGFSGAESVAANIIKDLPDSWEGYYAAPEGKGCEMARKMEINVIPCNTSDISEIKAVAERIKPDAIHAHDCRMSFNCARAGFEFTAHLHANWGWMKKPCPKSFLLAYACMKAKNVICVSQSIIDEYLFAKPFLKKLRALENTVDGEHIRELAAKNTAAEADLCFVGRLVAEKEPLLFLQLVSLLKAEKGDIRAFMVGDGEMRTEVEKRIEELDLFENVKLCGFDENPYKYMKNSRIGVMTSSVEGFGLVAVEEMVLGLPVVAFPVGGLLKIITEDCGLLAGDIHEMKDEILKLLGDGEYYQKKSEGALSRAAGYCNREEYINNIIKCYEHR